MQINKFIYMVLNMRLRYVWKRFIRIIQDLLCYISKQTHRIATVRSIYRREVHIVTISVL